MKYFMIHTYIQMNDSVLRINRLEINESDMGYKLGLCS